jgi:mannose-6-phosphate isomerase-like protein (cupin superfamily)
MPYSAIPSGDRRTDPMFRGRVKDFPGPSYAVCGLSPGMFSVPGGYDWLSSGIKMEALSATANAEVVQDSNFEVISFAGETLAMIIRDSFSKNGVNFLTPKEFTQQLAYMEHPAGKVIDSHLHRKLARRIEGTQEVLFVKRGRILVKLYTADQDYLSSHVLYAGDVILLASGGHGFEMLEDASFIEVKQGPYIGEHEKVRFASTRQSHCSESSNGRGVQLEVKEGGR